MNRHMGILLFMLASIIVVDGTSEDTLNIPFKKVIKFYPLHLRAAFPTIQFGYEHRLGRRMSLNLETGYVADFLFRQEDLKRRGFKFREEFRFYVSCKRLKTRSDQYKAGYFAADLHQVIIDFEDHSIEKTWREAGWGLKVGMAEHLGRLVLDFGLGVTWRYMNNRPPDIWGTLYTWGLKEQNNYRVVAPVIRLGIGYRLQ
jgi:hypothetical protein